MLLYFSFIIFIIIIIFFQLQLKNLELLKTEVCKLVSHYEKGFTYAIPYDDKIRVYIENLCNTVNLLQTSYAKVVKLVKVKNDS